MNTENVSSIHDKEETCKKNLEMVGPQFCLAKSNARNMRFVKIKCNVWNPSPSKLSNNEPS
jgi:hypothetical protein